MEHSDYVLKKTIELVFIRRFARRHNTKKNRKLVFKSFRNSYTVWEKTNLRFCEELIYFRAMRLLKLKAQRWSHRNPSWRNVETYTTDDFKSELQGYNIFIEKTVKHPCRWDEEMRREQYICRNPNGKRYNCCKNYQCTYDLKCYVKGDD